MTLKGRPAAVSLRGGSGGICVSWPLGSDSSAGSEGASGAEARDMRCADPAGTGHDARPRGPGGHPERTPGRVHALGAHDKPECRDGRQQPERRRRCFREQCLGRRRIFRRRFSVRGTSASNIWAAGDTVTSYPVTKNLILHWAGSHWRIVASPSIANSPNFLNGVRPQSRTTGWAVGRYVHGNVSRTLIVHLSQGHWRIVSSPNAGTGANDLRGVVASSATSSWAVGDHYNGTVDRTLILRWNGQHWRTMTAQSRDRRQSARCPLRAVAGQRLGGRDLRQRRLQPDAHRALRLGAYGRGRLRQSLSGA